MLIVIFISLNRIIQPITIQIMSKCCFSPSNHPSVCFTQTHIYELSYRNTQAYCILSDKYLNRVEFYPTVKCLCIFMSGNLRGLHPNLRLCLESCQGCSLRALVQVRPSSARFQLLSRTKSKVESHEGLSPVPPRV